MDAASVHEGQWIPDDWAMEGSDRTQFIRNVLLRFCRPMFESLNLQDVDFATDFQLSNDPAQLSVVDQLAASLLGYNWNIVGYLSCTDVPQLDRLDSISRFEYTKARDFLENWLRTEGYKSLSFGPRSKSFQVNLIESVHWRCGILVIQEAASPRDFYQINRSFKKLNVQDAMKEFGEEIWNSSNPFDSSRKVCTVSIFPLLYDL